MPASTTLLGGPSSKLVSRSRHKNVMRLYFSSFHCPKNSAFPLVNLYSFIYTNKKMFSAEVLKCLPIYKFAPRAFKDEKKKKKKAKSWSTHARKRKQNGNRGTLGQKLRGSLRCLRRRASKQALYTHLQRVTSSFINSFSYDTTG